MALCELNLCLQVTTRHHRLCPLSKTFQMYTYTFPHETTLLCCVTIYFVEPFIPNSVIFASVSFVIAVIYVLWKAPVAHVALRYSYSGTASRSNPSVRPSADGEHTWQTGTLGGRMLSIGDLVVWIMCSDISAVVRVLILVCFIDRLQFQMGPSAYSRTHAACVNRCGHESVERSNDCYCILRCQ